MREKFTVLRTPFAKLAALAAMSISASYSFRYFSVVKKSGETLEYETQNMHTYFPMK